MRKTTKQNIGISEGEFTKPLRAIGDKVVLKKHEVYHEIVRDGILVPISADINARMNKGTVMSIGPKAIKELNGLNVGDVVLYDHLSVFHDTHPIVVLNAENIICKVVE